MKVEDGGLGKYSPQNTQELEDIKTYQMLFRKHRDHPTKPLTSNYYSTYTDNTGATLKTKEDTQHLSSTRKLLMQDETSNPATMRTK